MRTASRRNLSLRLSAMIVLLDGWYSIQGRGTKLLQIQFAHLKRILKLDQLRLRGPNGANTDANMRWNLDTELPAAKLFK